MSGTILRVTQVASNPEYAGLERHVSCLIAALQQIEGVEPSLVVFHDGQLVDEVRGLGVPVEVVSLSWVFDLSAITRLARILKGWNTDILHSHGYKSNVISALAARRASVPYVVRTEHPMEPYNGFDRLKIRTYEALDTFVGNRFTDQIITVSDDLRRQLAPRYPNKKLVTVHNGIPQFNDINPQRIKETRESMGFDESNPLLGIVGRLVPVKRHVDFLEAAALIVKQRPDTRFLIIGGGALFGQLHLEVKRLGLQEAVHFLGFRSDVIDWIAALDLLVFSSLYEGIPYTLLEAMSLGVPVVGTAVGGMPEIVADGETGILVPSQDPRALAQACLELLENPDQRKTMSWASRERCLTHFSDFQMANTISSIYRDIVSQDEAIRLCTKAG